MPRKKGGGSDSILPWLTARTDGTREPFVMISPSLLKSTKFCELPLAAQRLYLCMATYAGKAKEFEFPQSVAKKDFAIHRNTLRKATNQLIEHGFLERVEDGTYSQYAPAKYRFSLAWKQNPRT